MLIKEKKILIDNIKITFFASNRSKSIRISIHQNKGVRVSVPLFVSFKSAKIFTQSKINWIKKNISKMENMKSSMTVFRDGSEFKTKFKLIKVKRSNQSEIKSIVNDNKIEILTPNNFDFKCLDNQLIIRKEIVRFLRQEAENYLPNRVEYFAKKYDLNYKKVTIKNTKTRWGSCSYINNINLNLHLMRLPDKLIDYVILHELAHTKVKNHQKEFWDLLDFYSGDAKGLDKELKKYNTHIF